jgi:hypothetical protein
VNFVNFWKIVLATIVMFGAGVTTGGLLVSHIDRGRQDFYRRPPMSFGGNEPMRPFNPDMHGPGRGMPEFPFQFPRPRQPDMLDTNFVKQLDDALKLTQAQQDSIRKIIAEGQERNHAIWTNNAGQMREVTLDVRHRIRELLNDEQQKKFEEVMKQVPPRHPQGGTNGPPGFLRGPMPRRLQGGTNGPAGFNPGEPMMRGGPGAWRGPSGD